jgi:hypothetical protein
MKTQFETMITILNGDFSMQKTLAKKERLRKLGVRKDVKTVTECYVRLLNGRTPYSLYSNAKHDKRTGEPRVPLVDKRLAHKLYNLFKEGGLNFLLEEHEETLNAVIGASKAPIKVEVEEFEKQNPGLVESITTSRQDHFTQTRYQICERFEQLAPEALFTRTHLMEIGYSERNALDLMVRYDELVTYRVRAQVNHSTYNYETGMITQEPNGMANFPAFTDYLGILYDVYVWSKYPKTQDSTDSPPPRYVKIAKQLHINGEMESDEHLIYASEDIYRYQIWKGNAPWNAYFKSLKRIKRTKPTHDKFVETLKAHFYAGRKSVKNG